MAVNAHMTHLEDLMIDGGVEGTRNAINFLRSMRDMLDGSSTKKMNTSVKFDGAPAVFAGVDPKDGQFFVAKKSIFNKTPKVYKSLDEVDADTSGDLNMKMRLAFTHFQDLGIRGIIQGDFMFTQDEIETDTIDGETYLTFQPNTIVYAIPTNTDLAKEILSAKVGVVWHTKYTGDSLSNLNAVFGKPIADKLRKTKDVWSLDAVYQDLSGTATFTKNETAELTKTLSDAGKIFNRMRPQVLNMFADIKQLNATTNIYVNKNVRDGKQIANIRSFVMGLINHIEETAEKEAAKRKTEKGKEAARQKFTPAIEALKATPKAELFKLFELYNLLVKAKIMVVRKLDTLGDLKTLLRTKDGFEVTGQEGFVAIDHTGKNSVKLVDRMQFSRANFSDQYIKGFQR